MSQQTIDFSPARDDDGSASLTLAHYAERAYLEYALSVVKGRALPDVCDGQKPVQRRILYAMERMGQDFALRYPLVDGQGNFGSRDGDGAAAMRYTEARLTPISRLLLDEIDMGTVDFIPNYDGSTEEPRQLPARLPLLFLNFASGIAVGLATEIPSHN